MFRGDKRAQFYLVAAIIIISVIIGFVTIALPSHTEKKHRIRGYDIAEELKIESEKVLEYLTKQRSSVDKAKVIENFTKGFDAYAGDDIEIYFITGDQTNIEGYKYVGSVKEVIDVGFGGEKINTTIEGGFFEFELEKGENFYFVIIQEEADGGRYIITN